jgi:hypothetical protein
MGAHSRDSANLERGPLTHTANHNAPAGLYRVGIQVAILTNMLTIVLCSFAVYKLSFPSADQSTAKLLKTASQLAYGLRELDGELLIARRTPVPAPLIGELGDMHPRRTTDTQIAQNILPSVTAAAGARVERKTLRGKIAGAANETIENFATTFNVENAAVRNSMPEFLRPTSVFHAQQYRIPSETAMVQRFLQQSHRLRSRVEQSSTPAVKGLHTFPEESRAHISRRLVIAVGGGMHSGLTDAQSKGMFALPLLRNFVPDLLRVAQPWHIYRCVDSSSHLCNLILDYTFSGAECTWRTIVTTHFIRIQAPGRRCTKSLTG